MLFKGLTCCGQGNVGIKVSTHYGKLLSIIKDFPYTKQALQMDAGVIFFGDTNKYWLYAHNFPSLSVNYNYSNYGNNDILGSSHGVFSEFLNNRDPEKFVGLQYGAGIGVSYFTKPFNAISNPTNNVIGSRLSALITLTLNASFKISENSFIETGLSIRHNSNGHFSVPNVGANMIMSNICYKYIPSQFNSTSVNSEVNISRKFRFGVNVGAGLHESEGTASPIDGPTYPVYSGQFKGSYRYNVKSSVSLGVSLNYYKSMQVYSVNEHLFEGEEVKNALKSFLFIGHESHFGKMSFLMNVGVNVYYPFRKELIRREQIEDIFMDNVFSNEIALRYYLFDPISDRSLLPNLNLGLRIIGGKADFFFVGLGVLI